MGNGMNKILPGVFIGNFRDAEDKEQIGKNKITHIVSIHDKASPILEGIKYKCIKVGDSPDQDLAKYFWECIDFIHHARVNGGAVLVHCIAGVSRSTTVVAAYVMVVTSLGWKDSISFIRCSRRIADPNFGFQRQLQDFELKKLVEVKTKLGKKYPLFETDDPYATEILEDGLEKYTRDVEENQEVDYKRLFKDLKIKRKLAKKYPIFESDDLYAKDILENGLRLLSKEVEENLHIDKIKHYEQLRKNRNKTPDEESK